MTLKTLVETYFHCRSNKRYSMDSAYFEMHWERDLLRLLEDVNARDLVPFLYSFIRTYPCPREVNACQMPTKILQDFFDVRVRPFIDKRLTDRTFNNRKGFGPDKAVACLQDAIRRVSRNYTRDCYVIERDIQAYFPSADLQRSYDNYREVIEAEFQPGAERDDLLYILHRTVWAYPSLNTHLKSPRSRWSLIPPYKSVVFNDDLAKGAALGNQHWQVSQNYDINEYDWRQIRNGLEYIRFVDDKRWVVQNKEAGLAYVNGEERWQEEHYGYKSHPRKKQVQHYSKGGYYLGYYYKFDRLYISNRIVRRCKRKIRTWNRMPAPSRVDAFLSSVNSYLGRVKRPHVYAYGIIRDLVDMVSQKWLVYVHYNDERRCFQANGGYTHNELLAKKYHFKIKEKNGDHSRTNQCSGVAATCSPDGNGVERRSRRKVHETRTVVPDGISRRVRGVQRRPRRIQ